MRLLLLLVLLWLCPPAAAQSVDAAREPGEKALLFSFNGLYLGSFNGGVGTKWWMSRATALTAGVQLGASSRDSEASESASGYLSELLSAGLSIGAEFHEGSRARLSPFIGVEVGASVRRLHTKNSPPLSSQYTGSEQVERTAMVEGAVSFGLEYRISERFSVAGRQALSASVTRGTVTYTGKEAADDEGGVSGYSVGLGASTLTLAVYF